jgi:uncharacterized membrane protein
MRTQTFVRRLAHPEIVRAIRDAEENTSATIRVFVQRGKLQGDALPAAQKKFQQLRLHESVHRNGVLIYVVPRAHKFAVVGDEAIHAKCGDAYWQQMVDKMREHFRSERFSEAIVDAIRDAGEVLAKHFPKATANK